MSKTNSLIQLLKSVKAVTSNVRYKIEYYLHANKAHAWHKLKGGTTSSRLLRHASYNWQALTPPAGSRPDRQAIFVAYHPGRKVPLSTINYLQSLINCGFEITYIHNGPLDSELRASAEKYCVQIICRENIGQDFGAWKDSLIDGFKNNRYHQVNWLLLCNDSNFFLKTNAKYFENEFSNALGEEDIDLITLNKNLEIAPHYQSYFICYHKRLFLNANFIQFWHQYRPLSNRHHAIAKGEMRLTSCITNSARSKILYNWPDLYIELSHTALKRSEFYSLLPKGCMYLAKDALDTDTAEAIVNKLELHRAFMILELHNPSHAFALLFSRHCKSPFLKKDIVKHGCYSIAQITDLLISLNIEKDSEEWNEILNYYILAGNNSSYLSNAKEAYKQGVPLRGQQFRGHGNLMSDMGLTTNE